MLKSLQFLRGNQEEEAFLALAWRHAGVLRELECGEEKHLPDRQLG